MSKELTTAISAAENAGEILKKYFHTRKNLTFTGKNNAKNIISKADIAAETTIIKEIKQTFPKHAFYSEESKDSGEKSEYLWVIDPLDGTNNFAMGIPQFSISISLLKGDNPVLGVIHHPFLQQTIYAEKGKGAYLNGKKLNLKVIRNKSKLTIAIVAGYSAEKKQFPIIRKLLGKVHRIFTHWAPSVDYFLLAQGEIDLLFSIEDEIEDQTAGLLIVKEAGAIIKDLTGNDFVLEKFSEKLPTLTVAKNLQSYNQFINLIENR